MEENMTPAPATSPQKDRIRLTELSDEERKHILDEHLTIIFNEKRDRIEIGYVCKCKKPGCHAPEPMLAFYVCPQNPCPGSNGG